MRRLKSDLLLAAATLVLLGSAVASTSHGSELVYQPINPSFGGNPFNSDHLLALADRQNKHQNNGSSGGSSASVSALSQGQQFVNQLQSRMMSALASNVTEAIFGENPQLTGEVVFGTQTISWVNEGNNINLTIFDTATGATTTIQVPSLAFAQ